jgi:hypothetical protein
MSERKSYDLSNSGNMIVQAISAESCEMTVDPSIELP